MTFQNSPAHISMTKRQAHNRTSIQIWECITRFGGDFIEILSHSGLHQKFLMCTNAWLRSQSYIIEGRTTAAGVRTNFSLWQFFSREVFVNITAKERGWEAKVPIRQQEPANVLKTVGVLIQSQKWQKDGKKEFCNFKTLRSSPSFLCLAQFFKLHLKRFSRPVNKCHKMGQKLGPWSIQKNLLLERTWGLTWKHVRYSLSAHVVQIWYTSLGVLMFSLEC